MAYITKFEIENFKGIKNLSLDIHDRNTCPVITLVGLNESGKTTILEAISHFVTSVDTVSEQTLGASSGDPSGLVPISKKANFTGDIIVKAFVTIDDKDIGAIEKIFSEKQMEVKTNSIPENFTISRMFAFEEGNFIGPKGGKNVWALEFYVKGKRAKKFKQYERPTPEELENGKPDLWLECIRMLRKALPSIAYFPTFLVDVPDPIYLSPYGNEDPKQKHYREVLQDVLESIGEGISLEKHVVDRIKKFRDEHSTDNDALMRSQEKGEIDAVFEKMNYAISQEVIGSWRNIFGRAAPTFRINISWNVDNAKGGLPYISFSFSDGATKYALHERSLGFRWFFLFLLFTRFKRNMNRPTLFLFDEPASNLHPRAQQQLLEGFEKIIEHNNKIIYSTHSVDMIHINWLSFAYIVKNDAIDYDTDDNVYNFASASTSISAQPYRQFVGTHPEKTSYYKPILDKLDYVLPPLNPDGPVLITEGISDYHAFKFYAQDILKEAKVTLIPGLGDGSHSPQIATLVGKATKFIVLLDDDSSGQNAAKKYREKWMLTGANIATIGELNPKAQGKNLEKLLSPETQKNIREHFSMEEKSYKKRVRQYFAEANAMAQPPHKSKDTEKLIRSIISEAVSRILNQ